MNSFFNNLFKTNSSATYVSNSINIKKAPAPDAGALNDIYKNPLYHTIRSNIVSKQTHLINHLKENLNVKSVVLHGICIGSASSLYAATSNDCDIIDAIIAEGMFINFSESMKNHYRERKKPVYFLDQLVNMWMKIYTGHTMHYGPINVIDKLETPLLMLHSKEDLYSRIDKANILFEKATSKNKKFVEFDKGRHSFIRINNTEKYDNEIIHFLNNL